MYETLKFDLARNCLRYFVKKSGITKMHIPYYLCDVIRHTLVEENCKPIFYHIDDKFYPAQNFPEEDFILYPNYWGIYGKNVEKLSELYPRLVVDNAHAYFDEPSGTACFNAGHKFGHKNSYLWIKTQTDTSAEQNQIYQNPELNDKEDKSRRKQIFLDLHKKYKDINLLEIDTNTIPFCYPCLLKSAAEADNLVKILKEEGKTVYRYWSPLPESFNEYKFYSRLVPIPVLPH